MIFWREVAPSPNVLLEFPLALKTNFQHSPVKPNLESSFASIRDVDATYHAKNAGPSLSYAPFANAVQVQTEFLWAQKSDKKKEGAAAGGKAAAVCYNCHNKGHFAKDYPLEEKNRNFGHRLGHTKFECTTKIRVRKAHQAQPPPPPPPPPPSLYFHHGEACMASCHWQQSTLHGQMSGLLTHELLTTHHATSTTTPHSRKLTSYTSHTLFSDRLVWRGASGAKCLLSVEFLAAHKVALPSRNDRLCDRRFLSQRARKLEKGCELILSPLPFFFRICFWVASTQQPDL